MYFVHSTFIYGCGCGCVCTCWIPSVVLCIVWLSSLPRLHNQGYGLLSPGFTVQQISGMSRSIVGGQVLQEVSERIRKCLLPIVFLQLGMSISLLVQVMQERRKMAQKRGGNKKSEPTEGGCCHVLSLSVSHLSFFFFSSSATTFFTWCYRHQPPAPRRRWWLFFYHGSMLPNRECAMLRRDARVAHHPLSTKRKNFSNISVF
jgi:hypothetical protein